MPGPKLNKYMEGRKEERKGGGVGGKREREKGRKEQNPQ